MAERFVEVDRNTPMLLPADLRDWVPEDDLVHFVIEGWRLCGTLGTRYQKASSSEGAEDSLPTVTLPIRTHKEWMR
jgi:hypothetical protein